MCDNALQILVYLFILIPWVLWVQGLKAKGF